MYIADLHIHSRFSYATSKDCDLPHLDWWARRKGIQLLGTGDFTHPVWRSELKEQLVPVAEGVYTLRENFRIPSSGSTPYFVVTGEISCIYQKNGKTRKVHNLILLPNLEATDQIATKLESIGNLHSDGRPILRLDCRDLLEFILEICPNAELIPAHIWTPHYSLFGSFSAFSSVEECFGDLSNQIHALETGLSSDPSMNWQISALDRYTLLSNSDAHSPSKLGREANCFDTNLSFPDLQKAIQTGSGFLGTIEFFPEEGKYYLDGHRKCNVCLTPTKTMTQKEICPVCGAPLTIGVAHRILTFSDRPKGYCPKNAKPFKTLIPLPEVIAASIGKSITSKKTQTYYETLLFHFGTEFFVLCEAPLPDIAQVTNPYISEGIRRLRVGHVNYSPGYDGQYGKLSIFTPHELEQRN